MQPRYQIFKAHSAELLQLAVSEAMADGWQCQGSPSFDNDRLVWFQAMTRGPQEEGVRLKEPKRK